MKMRLLLTLAWLAISFALPTFAKEQNTVDPEVRQQIEAAIMKLGETINKHDAAAVAALYTQDAVQVWSFLSEGGVASGQQAIEKRYAVEFASSPGEFAAKLIQVYPIGSEISAIAEKSWGIWKKDYIAWIYARDADTWKIRNEYVTTP
jgi:ketosteroid isomerase-like protein